MAVYGLQKFMGGETVLRGVGTAIKNVGIEVSTSSVFALFFAVVAAGIELGGGLLLVIGLFFRTAAFGLCATMLVATLMLLYVPEPEITRYGFPLIMMMILFGLMWTGPGNLSIQKD